MISADFDHLKHLLQGVGASKIIYALVMPETEEIKRKAMLGDVRAEFERTLHDAGAHIDAEWMMNALERSMACYFEQFREAWTQKQDAMDKEFFDRWRQWSSPIVQMAEGDFPFQYPTAGASEGLRALIGEYGARALEGEFKPEIALFKGEYEGFDAYAGASGIPVTKHDRGNWRQAVKEIAATSKDKPVQIYLSQPSAIDGNVWKDYDAFLQEMANKAPHAEVIVDLTYVGCITKDARIRTDYPNTPAVVFSLSKPLGAYYDRIGGVVARTKPDLEGDPYKALFGNKWFKNLTSISIGIEFMKTYGVYDLPRKYAGIQQKAIDTVSANLKAQGHKVALHPSDVFLLATGEMPRTPGAIHRYLERPADGRSILRICLTPTMGEILGMAQTHEVHPRYYERIDQDTRR